MVEKQTIDGQDVWLKVNPYHVERSNPNIIPTEYFTASVHYSDPAGSDEDGEPLLDEDGETALFESPVAALTYAWKKIKGEKNKLQ